MHVSVALFLSDTRFEFLSNGLECCHLLPQKHFVVETDDILVHRLQHSVYKIHLD